MQEILSTAASLLEQGKVGILVGQSRVYQQRYRPVFARSAEQVKTMNPDLSGNLNLAVYLTRAEIKKYGIIAMLGDERSLRSLLRLASENQVREGQVLVLVQEADGGVKVMETFAEMEDFVERNYQPLNAADQALIDRLDAMTPAERREFWKKEFEKCTKCFACRQACPLCYCATCIVEQNQPQWVSVPASSLGVMEWHMVRSMHLAGRCTACGQCAQACPVNIPLHLLPIRLGQEIEEVYGFRSGMKSTEPSTLSTFKPDDKESFIG